MYKNQGRIRFVLMKRAYKAFLRIPCSRRTLSSIQPHHDAASEGSPRPSLSRRQKLVVCVSVVRPKTSNGTMQVLVEISFVSARAAEHKGFDFSQGWEVPTAFVECCGRSLVCIISGGVGTQTVRLLEANHVVDQTACGARGAMALCGADLLKSLHRTPL